MNEKQETEKKAFTLALTENQALLVEIVLKRTIVDMLVRGETVERGKSDIFNIVNQIKVERERLFED